jgi:asparagine synthase (glutamine-hydrolysing)
MCGIAGAFDSRERRELPAALFERMNDVQLHRGPDEGSFWREPGVGLAHRRLSIIDLATGQQPMFNEDSSVCVVFNGEIYNFGDLVPELTKAGHRFKTRSDTEVIVHAWEEWGVDCVKRFRGMFAFAVYDRRQQALFLARDRLGVKPLFYSVLADGLVLFGSELKTLLCHPRFDRSVDRLSVEDYFAVGYVPEPRTIYAAASKLEPGHWLLFERGAAQPRRGEYWDVQFTLGNRLSEADLVHELNDRIAESVRLRMISEVPIGAFLSGGVDSSAVVAAMAGLTPQAVNTCSIAFKDPAYDESRYAGMVAERYRTNHRVEVVESDDFDLLDELARLYDEPFADSSAIPTYRVCQLARKHVTVALSGDGGDESFGGYKRYRTHVALDRRRALLPLGVRQPLFGAIGSLYAGADRMAVPLPGRATLRSMGKDSVEGYLDVMSVVDADLRSRIFSREMRQSLGGYSTLEVFRRHAARANREDPLALVQYLDLKTYLVGDINTKVDRASMAHSLEVREPLMDHELVEWLATIPSAQKIRGSEGKYLLKKALEPKLPHDVLYRRKMGFAVPLAAWFRGPLRKRVRATLGGTLMRDCGLFRGESLDTMADQHERGTRDHSAAIWSLLMFEAFLRREAGPLEAARHRVDVRAEVA